MVKIHYSPEKSALLSAVAEKRLFQLIAALERASTLAQSDPRRQIYAMGMTYREWALQHPQLYRLLLHKFSSKSRYFIT